MQSCTPETRPQLSQQAPMERTILQTEGTDASRSFFCPAETWRIRIVSDFINHSVSVGVARAAHC